jgi:hypothetical protein
MSPLKWQTRVISCFPSGTGFAMGSVEGRVAIQYVLPHTHLSLLLTDTVCLPRYVEEKDSQSVPQPIPVKRSAG